MELLAKTLGTLLGYTIGHAIKICGPQLVEILADAIRRGFKDSAEVSKPNDALQRYGDSLGLFAGVRDAPHSPAAGHGYDAAETD